MFTQAGLKHIVRIALAFAFAVTAGALHAETYPSRYIKLIVPFSAGGSSDAIARRYAERLSAALGQTIVIENRPGAATNIGSALVANATPDGHTLLLLSNQLPMNAVFGPKPQFDFEKAFIPVSMIARLPFLVAANVSFPFNSIDELLKAAKEQPGKYTIGSAQLEVLVELMRRSSGADLRHIPYRGGAETIIDTIAGRVDMTLTLGPVLLPQVNGKKLKALGVGAKRRLDAFPSTMTFEEAGVPYDAAYWYGVGAPAGTPRAVVERLSNESRRIIESPEFVGYLKDSGGFVDWMGPDEMRAVMKRDLTQWRDLAKEVPNLIRAGDQK